MCIRDSVTLTATSVADPTKSGSITVTVFSAPGIGIRLNNGQPAFYTTTNGADFVPRGNNYLHFNPTMTRVQDGSVGYGRSTLNSMLYDPAKIEQALASMETQQYNVVRIFLDVLDVGDIGNDSGNGLSQKYLGNLADFMSRAKAHRIYVLPIFEQLPWAGGYRNFITGSLQSEFGNYNIQILTQPGVDNTRKFWRDLILGLVAAHAPMDALYGYELMGEFYVDNSAPPLNQTSGVFQTANGSSYNMADTTSRVAMQNENMVHYANEMRTAIQALNPGALTVIGFFTYNGTNPPPFPAITTSDVDFIDLHGWPDNSGTTIQQLVSAWHVNGYHSKPLVMGEYDGFINFFPTTPGAATALKSWQVASCPAGFAGWILWTWDTEASELPGLNIWSALDGNGEINQALAPIYRPDPCSN